jgi:hypothetical protein
MIEPYLESIAATHAIEPARNAAETMQRLQISVRTSRGSYGASVALPVFAPAADVAAKLRELADALDRFIETCEE